jgi:hypothetical protein
VGEGDDAAGEPTKKLAGVVGIEPDDHPVGSRCFEQASTERVKVDAADQQIVEEVAQLAPLAQPLHEVPLRAASAAREVLVDAGARRAQPLSLAVHPGQESLVSAPRTCSPRPGRRGETGGA